MLALTPSTIIALEPNILLHSLPEQDSFYAFNVQIGDHFRLNRTSYWVLEAIDEGIEWATLLDRFLATFEVSAIQGEEDLRDLINGLHEERIIGRQEHEEEKENTV